ncbi:MAG: VPLPA-CTERM-specific exosortase XrtD [Pseudomonadota bacterium]
MEALGEQQNSRTSEAGFKLLLWTTLGSLLALAVVFQRGLIEIEYRWSTLEEYSHGYMIPLVALFLLWKVAPDIKRLDWRPTVWSLAMLAVALVGWALGELSSLFIIVHYSLLLALVSIALAVVGWRGVLSAWSAFAYLIFMIPLPVFILNGLSAQLQLMSTDLGVWFIRLFGISVFVEGNVIDLGAYKLQVVEACSGLNYLFPLMSFGFLIAVLYQGATWHRWLIFLATIPITLVMNSFRIGVIGVTVEHFGTEAAEGFLHAFEGWFVFMACLGVLLLLIWFLSLFGSERKAVLEQIDLDYPTLAELQSEPVGQRATRPTAVAALILCILAIPAGQLFSEREELIPQRDTFAQFPLIKEGWAGRESAIQEKVLDALLLSDYILADYRQAGEGVPVNLYVAYYASQRTGSTIHSPRSCMPGGGWQITELSQIDLSDALGMEGPRVNRTVIRLGEQKQLVYYWFQQRGRYITNEYLAKWYLFLDGMTMRRSDGALVRIVSPIPPGTDVKSADARLQDFIRTFYPELPRFIPGTGGS